MRVTSETDNEDSPEGNVVRENDRHTAPARVDSGRVRGTQ